jgi:hypothetical protein
MINCAFYMNLDASATEILSNVIGLLQSSFRPVNVLASLFHLLLFLLRMRLYFVLSFSIAFMSARIFSINTSVRGLLRQC